MAGELVFVTGGSGHLGYRIIVEALQRGYRVRAAVRSEAKATLIKNGPSVKACLEASGHKSSHAEILEFVVVLDILAEDAYDHVLKDVSYIIHAASPLAIETDNYDSDIIQPAIKGTVGILRSAIKVPTVKRIVITSSEVAVVPWKELFLEESETIFKPTNKIPPPLGPYGHPVEAYAASKTLALHASEKFIENEKPHYDIINIMPSFIIGRNELITDPKHITDGTNSAAFNQLLGIKNPLPTPGTSVHVNDVALIQVLALDSKIAGNQNFLTSSGGIEGTFWEDAVAIIKKHFPDEVKEGVFPLGGAQPTKAAKVDSSRTEEVFGLKFKSFEEQVLSVAKHYLELVAET